MDIKRLVGINIKLLRVKLELSQEEFGNRIGMAATSISDWEAGKTDIRISSIEKMCDEFNTSLCYFFTPFEINKKTAD